MISVTLSNVEMLTMERLKGQAEKQLNLVKIFSVNLVQQIMFFYARGILKFIPERQVFSIGLNVNHEFNITIGKTVCSKIPMRFNYA